MKRNFHIPGRPKTPEPAALAEIAASIQHPDVLRSGLTTTKEGTWALLLVVKKDVSIPIEELEVQCIDFPIVYQEDDGYLPVARPAYPHLGE